MIRRGRRIGDTHWLTCSNIWSVPVRGIHWGAIASRRATKGDE